MPRSPELEPPARARLRGTLILCLAMLLWPIVEDLASILSRPYSPVEVVWVRTLRRASVFPLLMAACFAFYLVLTRLMRDETTASRLFYTALSVWVPLGLVVPWAWTTPTPRDFGLMASIGILGFLFLLGLDQALDAAPASCLAPFVPPSRSGPW